MSAICIHSHPLCRLALSCTSASDTCGYSGYCCIGNVCQAFCKPRTSSCGIWTRSSPESLPKPLMEQGRKFDHHLIVEMTEWPRSIPKAVFGDTTETLLRLCQAIDVPCAMPCRSWCCSYLQLPGLVMGSWSTWRSSFRSSWMPIRRIWPATCAKMLLWYAKTKQHDTTVWCRGGLGFGIWPRYDMISMDAMQFLSEGREDVIHVIPHGHQVQMERGCTALHSKTMQYLVPAKYQSPVSLTRPHTFFYLWWSFAFELGVDMT